MKMRDHEETPSPREIFRLWALDHAEQMCDATWEELTASQPGAHSSLAFGAAGIAFELELAARFFGEATFLEAAERWIRQASAHRDERLAFLEPEASLEHRMPAGAFFFGPAGVDYVRIVIAHECGDERSRARALERYGRLVRTAGEELPELYRGVAGGLLGTALLRARLGAATGLEELGNELFDRLHHAAVRRTDGTFGWPGVNEPGLGHGTGGIYHALLLWSRASGRPWPRALGRSLAAFLEASLTNPLLAVDRVIKPKLCGGFAGLAVVAATAHEVLRELDLGETAPFLTSARALARGALDHPPPRPPHLCCGRLGLAAPALAMARAEPAGDWRERAEQLTLSAMLYNDEGWGPHGLLTGPTGLGCMAMALAGESPGRLPGFDLLEVPGAAGEPDRRDGKMVREATSGEAD